MKNVPVYKATRDAGAYLHWTGNTDKDFALHWTSGPEYFTRKLSDCFLFVEGAKDSLPPVDTMGTRISIVLDTDIPDGNIALTKARIITMKGDEVIESGTVLISENKITKVGASA